MDRLEIAADERTQRSRTSPTVVLYTVGAFLGILILVTIVENGGILGYTLDDAYIHLALAKRVQEGLYGINPGEFAAPASSILFPFLIAAVPASIPGWQFLPLLINILSVLITIGFFLRVLRIDGRVGVVGMIFLAATLMIALNVASLVMAGMEHALQVALTVIGIWGLLELERNGRLPHLAIAALILAPLIRYENLAITLPACDYLALVGRRRAATFIVLVVGTIVIAFSSVLVAHGLGPLPTSILSKAVEARALFFLDHHFSGWSLIDASAFAHAFSDAARMSVLSGLATNLISNLANTQAWILLMLSVPLVIRLVRPRKPSERRLAGLVLLAAGLHMVCGTFDRPHRLWLYGYEMYVFAAVLFVLVALYGDQLLSFISAPTAPGAWLRPLALLVLTGIVFNRYTVALFEAPLASNFHYEVEMEVARFASDYWKKPLGIEPLGTAMWVSSYILDYGALASWDVHKAQIANPPDLLWMDKLARGHGVELAVIYRIPIVPPTWPVVARLHWQSELGKKLLGGDPPIYFYATDPAFAPEIRAKLKQFAETLPKGALLETL